MIIYDTWSKEYYIILELKYYLKHKVPFFLSMKLKVIGKEKYSFRHTRVVGKNVSLKGISMNNK